MRPFAYEAPTDAQAAVRLASVPATAHVTSPVQYKGGGTTLIDLMKLDVMQPTTLVDITRLNDERLRRIESLPNELRIGSLVTMARLHEDPAIVRNYPILTESLWQGASQQLRNMAFLGGNVLQRTRCSYFRDPSFAQCNKRNPGSGCSALDGANRGHAVLGTSEHCIALYAGDWAPALVALDARVEVLGRSGVRSVAFADLHRLPGSTPHIETNLMPGDLITAFVIPGGPRRRSLYRKIRDRESYQFANASAAVALEMDGDVVRDARIGLGGVATIPWRARTAERMLRGRRLTEASANAAAAAEFEAAKTRAHNVYKVALGRATMVRSLLEAQALEIA
ncbi:FAD binding domain-containing protein [Sphingomonas morindae]|uniref:Xanthine dehydrogenase family protein subunit M n=1 Tax=Sphingomonas morindae TaxID=1541170 RepID=A0ABY4XA92_9SPHN|nr:xanthine dehydrogenase family protein subunit M [Sphingomonas morindae]USI73891.1 xanthine dehydrogenase family protein subunit M [Sphingomonas morindae]